MHDRVLSLRYQSELSTTRTRSHKGQPFWRLAQQPGTNITTESWLVGRGHAILASMLACAVKNGLWGTSLALLAVGFATAGCTREPRSGVPTSIWPPASSSVDLSFGIDAPPALRRTPSCEQGALLTPFEGHLRWRAAYKSSAEHVFHYCPSWSHFGQVRPKGKWHHGLDIAAPSGTPVRAALAGTLSYARDPKGWGLYAKLRFRPKSTGADGTCREDDPVELIYAHLADDGPKPELGVERDVPAGTVVGRVGCSGNARGMCSPSPESHVHVSLRAAYGDHHTIDPLTVVGWQLDTPSQRDFSPSLELCSGPPR